MEKGNQTLYRGGSMIPLWFRTAAKAIARRMAYRTEYFISLICMFTLELVAPLFTFVIYTNSPGFAGWTFHQVLLLQGIFLLIKGFSYFSFFGIVWNSNHVLKRGDFDLTLIKPRNTLYMFICQSFDAEDIAKFIGGILITIYALSNIPGIAFSNILSSLFLLILGILLFFSLALFSSSFIFRFIRSWRVYEFLGLIEMIGSYPKSIYPKVAGTFFTAIIPIFIVAVFPAQAITGLFTKDILISSISVIVLVFIAVKTWYTVIKNYASAGG